MTDKANAQRAARNESKRNQVQAMRDRRRITEGPVPSGIVRIYAPKDMAGTMHPQTLKVWSGMDGEPILKDGAFNSKIGGDVLVGHLKGARIYTLALEERATCPRSCPIYRGCYGNALHRTRRWAYSPDLLSGLRGEIKALIHVHRKVLIRLHVVGDFPTEEYASFWRAMLDLHSGLHLFIFTAHRSSTAIGGAVASLAETGRAWVRHSGQTGDHGAITLDFPTEKTRIGDMTVCPEQRHAISEPLRQTHCGSCGLCWAGNTGIAFIEH
ncbi:hypothetical protein [Salipiger sp.]|uniref:GP88 family protein n=1 Tax=Salipiger sp. TaxID=2078585 RepID=UPI003A97D04E